MCNYLHNTSRPIRKSGVCYKVFAEKDGELRTWIEQHQYKNRDKEGYYNFTELYTFPHRPSGFCGFPTKKALKKALPYFAPWTSFKQVIYKVSYQEGIGRHFESKLCSVPIDIILFKRFKLLEEVKL